MSRAHASQWSPGAAGRLLEDDGPDGPDWQDLALCAETDPEAFFPEAGVSAADAKRVCRSCEVRPECLEYALARGIDHGVWGGLSREERSALRVPVTVPLLVLCTSGRHFARNIQHGCDRCEAETARERGRNQDFTAANKAARARRPKKTGIRTKGIAA